MGFNTFPCNPYPISTEKLDALRSGLTDLSEEVNGDANVYPYADVITIEDAVPANLAECNVKIGPVQDLHGYDKPWVGGAYKNKAKPKNYSSDSYDGTTFSSPMEGAKVIDDVVLPAGTYVASIKMLSVPSTQRTLTFYKTGDVELAYFVNLNEKTVGQVYTTTFTLSEESTVYAKSWATGGGEWKMQMQLEVGSTATTFAPYTNICPISGHTEVSVEVTDGDETTKTYTIALGDTIYGGTVDFDSGVMTVDIGTHTYSSENVSLYDDLLNNVRYAMVQKTSDAKSKGLYYDDTQMVCSNFFNSNNISVQSVDCIGGIRSEADKESYFIGFPKNVTLEEAKNAIDGMTVAYTLATPTTIQLTPQQIQLLKGQNTLTASTGQISVTVNGVSGAIGSMQEQVNATDAVLAELAADIAEQLPSAPTTDGAYVLTVTVADGNPTYSWESTT